MKNKGNQGLIGLITDVIMQYQGDTLNLFTASEAKLIASDIARSLDVNIVYLCDWHNCTEQAFLARKREGKVYCTEHNTVLDGQINWWVGEEDRVNGSRWAKALRRGK